MASVGDIFYSSWGYDQTNINYYQVISKTQKTVTIRELKTETTHDFETMCGVSKPIKDSFVGEPIRRKLNSGGRPAQEYIKVESYEVAYPWDGKPKRYSSYA